MGLAPNTIRQDTTRTSWNKMKKCCKRTKEISSHNFSSRLKITNFSKHLNRLRLPFITMKLSPSIIPMMLLSLASGPSFTNAGPCGWLCDDDGWGGGNNINNDDGGNEAPPAPEMEVFRETFTLDYDVVNYVELDASAIDALQDAVLGAAASSNTPDFVDVTVTRVAIDATEPPQQQEVEDPPAYSIPAKCYRKNGNLRKNRKCQAAAEAAEAAAAIAAAEAAMQENSAEHAYDAHHTISLKVSILAESPEAVFDFANNKVLRSEMADEICFALSGEAPFKKNGIANCELRLARKSGGAIGRNRNRSSP